MYSTATTRSCWIGLHDRDTEGTFGWADGNNSSYRNWAIGEPNQNGNEDCVQTFRSERWNDLTCTWKPNCYICRASGKNIFDVYSDSNTVSAVIYSHPILKCLRRKIYYPLHRYYHINTLYSTRG